MPLLASCPFFWAFEHFCYLVDVFSFSTIEVWKSFTYNEYWIPTGRKYLFCSSISDTVYKNVIESQLGTWMQYFHFFSFTSSLVVCLLLSLESRWYVVSSSEDNGYRMDDNVLLLSKNFWNFVDGEGVKNSLSSTNFQEKWILKVFFSSTTIHYFNFFLATSFEKTPLLNSFRRFLL